jgi:hypothetical protein
MPDIVDKSAVSFCVFYRAYDLFPLAVKNNIGKTRLEYFINSLFDFIGFCKIINLPVLFRRVKNQA